MSDENDIEANIEGRNFPDISPSQAKLPAVRLENAQNDPKYRHAKRINESQQVQNQAKIRDVNGGKEDTISENQKENLGNLNKDDEKKHQKDKRSRASQVTDTARTP